MNLNKRNITTAIFLLVPLFLEKVVWYLFPFTGLGGLICWPVALLVGGLSAYVVFGLFKRKMSMLTILSIGLLIVLLQGFILLSVHPQDYGGEPIVQLGQAKRALVDYEEISFNDFKNLNKAERVAYIYKFREQLPKSIQFIHIDTFSSEASHPRIYEIFNYPDGKQYDKAKIQIIETDSSVLIKEGNRTHNLNRHFFSGNASGYLDTLTKRSYGLNTDFLELNSGLEKVLYNILKETKKASR